MALAPDQLAAGAVPTVEADAGAAVPSSKTYTATAAWFQNQSGAARTVNLKLIDTDGSTVIQFVTETIPVGGANWPVSLGFPIKASQKMRWSASGATVYGLIGVVKN